MAAGLPLADTPDAASRWWVPAVQSVVLCLLFAAMSVAGLSLYVVVPLALLVVWLPRLVRSGKCCQAARWATAISPC